MGSPPPAGSKNVVFRLRSVNSIVIAPAKTGRDSRRRITVMKTDQTNKGSRSNRIPGARMLMTVVIKLMEPRIEEIPARCREKIAKSTDPPACARLPDNGG